MKVSFFSTLNGADVEVKGSFEPATSDSRDEPGSPAEFEIAEIVGIDMDSVSEPDVDRLVAEGIEKGYDRMYDGGLNDARE